MYWLTTASTVVCICLGQTERNGKIERRRERGDRDIERGIEREREREGEGEREREREREGEGGRERRDRERG